MITESTEIASLCSVNEFTLIEGHEVEMLDTLLVILMHSLAESIFTNNFADIFEDKIVGSQIRIGSEAIAFFLCLENCDGAVLLALEAFVLAFEATSTVNDAFNLSRTVDAVGIFATGSVSFCSGVCLNSQQTE